MRKQDVWVRRNFLFVGLLATTAVDPSARRAYYFDTSWRKGEPVANVFATESVTADPLPDAAAWTTRVPRVVWDGHDDVVRAHAAAWKMVGGKLHRPEPNTPFRRNFVYTPFGNSVFVWGSCFITMYGAYASNVFPFIGQLDNFYAAQRRDGFIPRQLGIYDGRSQFAPEDLSSVGGNIFAWAEWEWYCRTRDRRRLEKAYPVLLAYHEWMRTHRTWKDGTYFSSGWGCGMDNIPRVDADRYSPEFHHGYLSWVDVTLQQLFNACLLDAIRDVLRLPEDAALRHEIAELKRIVNEKMWDESDGLYHDLDRDGKRVPCRHIGGFWALLVPDLVTPERRARLIANLENPELFAAPCGTRSLAKGEKGYDPDGGNYWRGGVWCITDWMIVRGLSRSGDPLSLAAAHRLARRQVEAVAKVYADTGTIWESYDPERVAPGKLYGQPVRRDFVGFSGVTPIAMLVRDVLGLEIKNGEIVWTVRLLERHGVENLTLPNGEVVSLICAARKTADETPVIEVRASRPYAIERRPGGSCTIRFLEEDLK